MSDLGIPGLRQQPDRFESLTRIGIVEVASPLIERSSHRAVLTTHAGIRTKAIRDGDEERAHRVAVDHVQTSYRRVIAGYEGDGAAPDGR